MADTSAQLPQASAGTPSGTTRRRRTMVEVQITNHANGNGHAKGDSTSKSYVTKSDRKRPLLRRLKKRAIKHTWLSPLILLLAILSLYAINPTESNFLHRFIFLSYAYPSTPNGDAQHHEIQVLYGKGKWDLAFVTFYTTLLTFTREFIMQELLAPFAKSRFAAIPKTKQLRCMEQMYTALYFAFAGPAGLYVMRQTSVWYFRTAGMYEEFPHKLLPGVEKFYYLFEAAYWAQQALVMILGLEKPRKDFRELVLHHIVTLALVGLSYWFHFTRIGVAVYLTHDISDFFLAVSKTFHYLNSDWIIPFYASSVVSWIYLRHYLNLHILFSVLTEFRTIGPYELNWETEQYKCWISNVITFILLAMLQALNLFWLYCLLRSAWKFVVYGVRKDDRSEDEEEDGEGKELFP
ncbi:hypothetical protein N7532_007532, partial [Penicillium argentinense]